MVRMKVRRVVLVLVTVGRLTVVGMPMRMTSVAGKADRRPGEIQQTKTNQYPCGNFAAHGFDLLEMKHRRSQGDSDQSQRNRAKHVSCAAQCRDDQGLS